MAGNDVAEPIRHSAWNGIDGSMRAVDRDAFQGKAEQRLLLWIIESEGFEAAENDGIFKCTHALVAKQIDISRNTSGDRRLESVLTIGDDYAIIAINSLVRN